MEFKPTLQVARLEQVAPGELFIFDWKEGKCVGIKVVDTANNDQKMTLALGPTFPAGATRPVLIAEQRMSVVSFGKYFTVNLPVRPEDWILNEAAVDGPCIATNGNDIFFRVIDGRWTLFVNLKNGELCSAIPDGILAYTKAWEIGIQDADTLRLVIRGA